jgi:hypothetical protein
MEHYSVTSTLEDAAAEIKRSSFTVFRVPPRTAHAMHDAWREAAKILNNPPPSDDSADDLDEWTRIVGGHLHGYNEPSRAKRLFRAFPASSAQPWPNDRFRQVSRNVAEQLHGILLSCHAHLKDNLDNDIGLTVSQDQSCREKKSVEDKVSQQEQFQETATASSTPRKRRRLDQISTSLPAHCPLDYFLYHNNDPTAINCSEHVDRGLLIAVCLTDVPGLEILVKDKEDCEANCWFCPEVAIHNSNLYNEIPDSSVSDLICIMAGGELSRAIETDVRPCVHRVRNKLRRSRLSISYELRLLSND